jgi:hypothetical protein
MTDPLPWRQAEVRHLLSLSPDEVRRRAAERLIVCADVDALHRRMAEDLAAEIAAANAQGRVTLRLILPVGPVGALSVPHRADRSTAAFTGALLAVLHGRILRCRWQRAAA